MESGLVQALRRAVESAPHDVALRLHLAELLLSGGDRAGAVAQIAAALQSEPGNEAAGAAMTHALAPATGHRRTRLDSRSPARAAD